MSERTRDWIIATSYVALIYCTLEVAGLPLAYLRSHGWLRIFIFLLFCAGTAIGLRALLKNHPKNIVRLLAFFALLLIYYRVSHTIRLPEEQLHFFEYGLVGIFFLRALRHHRLEVPSLWFFAWLISSTAGWCDELLQGMTPNRHYDIRDVGFNAVAAGLGLLVYLICKKHQTTR